MAEMHDSQAAYSLRSEIRKKIFLRKLRRTRPRVVFSEKYLARLRSVFLQKRAHYLLALIDGRIGLIIATFAACKGLEQRDDPVERGVS